jgi:hypothetical protein
MRLTGDAEAIGYVFNWRCRGYRLRIYLTGDPEAIGYVFNWRLEMQRL